MHPCICWNLHHAACIAVSEDIRSLGLGFDNFYAVTGVCIRSLVLSTGKQSQGITLAEGWAIRAEYWQCFSSIMHRDLWIASVWRAPGWTGQVAIANLFTLCLLGRRSIRLCIASSFQKCFHFLWIGWIVISVDYYSGWRRFAGTGLPWACKRHDCHSGRNLSREKMTITPFLVIK